MEINKQPIEKQTLDPSGTLVVHSVFRTIQGEGPFTGMPAVFVRLQGCNLQCPLCDTDYTSKRSRIGPAMLLDLIKEMDVPTRLVVLTGGEPMRQNIGSAVYDLVEAGYTVQLETNGTLFIEDLPYHHPRFKIVCSPKAGRINARLAPLIDALKYVLHADDVDTDGLPRRALMHAAAPRVARPPVGFKGTVYLQPVDEQDALKNKQYAYGVITDKFGLLWVHLV